MLVPLANLFWLAVAPIALLVQVSFGDRAALLVVGLAGIALGLRVFWSHGGRYISATGMFGFSLATFGGFPCIYFLLNDQRATVTESLVHAAVAVYAASVIALVLQRSTSRAFADISSEPIPAKFSPWLIRTGIILLAVAGVAVAGGIKLGGIPEGAGWLGATLASVGFLRRKGRRITVPRLLATAAAFVAYVAFVFNGFGRLELIALGFGILIIAGRSAFPNRTVKAALVVAFIPGLVVLGASRAGGGKSLDFANPNDGLGSVVSPLSTFSQLLDRPLHRANGQTFLATATIYVPRSLWRGKIDGFGRQLAVELDPIGASRSPISYAATAQGEWYWNFGWAGVALSPLALAAMLRLIDRRLAAGLKKPVSSRREFLSLVAITILAVGIGDLFWTGSFAYAQRALGRMISVGGLLLVVTATSPRRPRGTQSPRLEAQPPRGAGVQRFTELAFLDARGSMRSNGGMNT